MQAEPVRGKVTEGTGSDAADFPDDLREHLSFELEECAHTLGVLIDEYAVDRERAATILRLRLGITGERPETLTRIGARFDFSRDRARQLHTKAVGELLRHTARSGRLPIPVYARRYPVGTRDSVLTRALLAETYATEGDIAVNDLAYLKLRLAGHSAADAKRVAGFVTQRIVAWRKKTNHLLSRLRETDSPAGPPAPWPQRIEWPRRAVAAAPLPTAAARSFDLADDGRGRFYLHKPGRDIGFDSGLEARLMRLLDNDDRIRTFQEYPDAVGYRVDGAEQVHFPTLVAELADGRRALIDVQPLGHIGFHGNREKARAARAWAHENGWGWMLWTGSALGEAELAAYPVPADIERQLVELLAEGPVRWPALGELRTARGLAPIDLLALAVRHEWRWDRTPFRLSAGEQPRTGRPAAVRV
ncbi:sigma factor-like helix-turn-helix DNA-binding protein [Nocardia carnea]|uniref:sigma factor-like helix-turn-helix DNA-binding protein n=1 Tax=Nocardia carnea TaxID=37328 RepID=UPI0024579C86|nr:sigma factor-like helix-turn-helix DNA-binding protein [Nocardia carnea]